MASEWGKYDLLGDPQHTQTRAKATVRKIMEQYLPPGGAEEMMEFLRKSGHDPKSYLGIIDLWSRDFRGEDATAKQWFNIFEKQRDVANQETSFGDRLGDIAVKVGLPVMTFLNPAIGAGLSGAYTYKQTGDWKKALLVAGVTYGAARLAKGAGGKGAGAAGEGAAGAGTGAAAGAAASTAEDALLGLPVSQAAGAGAAGAAGAGAAAASVPWYQTELGKTLIKFGLGAVGEQLLGGRTSEEKKLEQFSTAPFTSGKVQGFLPPALREDVTGPILGRGVAGIGALLANPGGLSPSVSEAILPRLAAESESIATNFRGLQANQAGAAARSNLPVSIKGALQSALDVAQERAQRGARREALTESEGLRRQDLGQTYNLLDAILQFTSSGRGQAIQGLGAASRFAADRQASRQALFGNLFPTE